MIAIQAINRECIPPIDICNLVEDIIVLPKNIENIRFLLCRRSPNVLADKIAKETIYACTSTSSKHNFSFLIVPKKKLALNTSCTW